MPPPPLAPVVATRRLAALRARKLSLTPVLDEDLDFSSLELQLNSTDPPRALHSQDSRVQLRVSHP
jgi:hypothetical protein